MDMKTVTVIAWSIALGVLAIDAIRPGDLYSQVAIPVQSDSARLPRDCPMASQVLTSGEPATKRSWALRRIGSCGANGGRTVAAILKARRSERSRGRELNQVVEAGLGLLDRTLYNTALEVATDPLAGDAARVQAFRILLSQVNPTSPPAYEELTGERPSSSVFDWGPTHGEPLPAGYRAEVLAAASRVERQNPPTPVAEAARTVAGAARFAIRHQRP